MASFSQPSTIPQLKMNDIITKLQDNMQGDKIFSQFMSQLMSKKSYATRVKHVYEYLGRYQLMPKKPYASKCEDYAQKSAEKGKRHLANGEYMLSLDFFGDAIKFATTTETIGIAYAKRSSALYNLKWYRECLLDIERAIAAGCDEKLKLRLSMREKLCKRALKSTPTMEATAAEDDDEKLRQELFRPPEKRMAGVSCASASLEISHCESMGRGVTATEDIQPGQVLVVEDPYVNVLNITDRNIRCAFCCSYNNAMIPCGTCDLTLYCNEECRAESWRLGHKFECPILPRLVLMALFKGEMLSLHIVLKARCQHKSWDKLFETVDSIDNQTEPKSKGFTVGADSVLTYDSENYAPIHTFETKEEKIGKREMFVECVVSAVLLYMLKEYTKFFADLPNVSDDVSTIEDGYFWRAGGLLLRHIFSSKINRMDIYAFFKQRTTTDKIECFARGIYAFTNLLNHSCSPNAHFIFRGTTITILASRLIKKGQQVCISYGENYWKSSLFRRTNLETKYKFKCECEACVNNWPQLFNLQPARFVSAENEKQFRHVLNETSARNFLQGNNKVDVNFVKNLYQYIAMLEECVPSKELYYYQEFIVINWMMLGNIGYTDRTSFYALDENYEHDENRVDSEDEVLLDFATDRLKKAIFDKIKSFDYVKSNRYL